jgi:hypothetical protein
MLQIVQSDAVALHVEELVLDDLIVGVEANESVLIQGFLVVASTR